MNTRLEEQVWHVGEPIEVATEHVGLRRGRHRLLPRRNPRMKTKVKVKRVELVKLVEGRTRKAENEYKREMAAYPAKIEAHKAAVVAKLEKVTADAKRGKLPEESRHGSLGVTLPPTPQRPSEGRELCNLRRILATLKIGAEDTILLSQEDADFYFGSCKL